MKGIKTNSRKKCPRCVEMQNAMKGSRNLFWLIHFGPLMSHAEPKMSKMVVNTSDMICVLKRPIGVSIVSASVRISRYFGRFRSRLMSNCFRLQASNNDWQKTVSHSENPSEVTKMNRL